MALNTELIMCIFGRISQCVERIWVHFESISSKFWFKEITMLDRPRYRIEAIKYPNKGDVILVLPIIYQNGENRKCENLLKGSYIIPGVVCW